MRGFSIYLSFGPEIFDGIYISLNIIHVGSLMYSDIVLYSMSLCSSSNLIIQKWIKKMLLANVFILIKATHDMIRQDILNSHVCTIE